MTTPTTLFDQEPIAFASIPQGELLIESCPVSGGTLYFGVARFGGAFTLSRTFVPAAAGGLTRYLRLTDAKSDAGVGLTATATGGACGISRTAGTSLTLVGEATSASAKTDKALFDFDLPDSHVAGANIALVVNCNTSGAGTITSASTTMTVAAYTETNGAEAALSVSAAQQIPAAAGNLTFTITGTGLVPGAHVVVELVMLVTSSSGANTGVINSVSYGA